jgi:hypothetical protein
VPALSPLIGTSGPPNLASKLWPVPLLEWSVSPSTLYVNVRAAVLKSCSFDGFHCPEIACAPAGARPTLVSTKVPVPAAHVTGCRCHQKEKLTITNSIWQAVERTFNSDVWATAKRFTRRQRHQAELPSMSAFHRKQTLATQASSTHCETASASSRLGINDPREAISFPVRLDPRTCCGAWDAACFGE